MLSHSTKRTFLFTERSACIHFLRIDLHLRMTIAPWFSKPMRRYLRFMTFWRTQLAIFRKNEVSISVDV